MAPWWKRDRPVPAGGAATCSCGAPLDPVDMDYGFQMPDVVFDMPADMRRERVSGRRKLILVQGCGGFVRTLLPVRLDVGSVRFGIWLNVSEDAVKAADPAWDEPDYLALEFTGAVANLLEPWGHALLGATARARPVEPNALPFVFGGDPVVESLLHQVWSRAEVVEALPALRHSH